MLRPSSSETAPQYLKRLCRTIFFATAKAGPRVLTFVPVLLFPSVNRVIALAFSRLGSVIWGGRRFRESISEYGLVLVATNASEYELPALLSEVKRSGIQTIVAPDNWDNLSTKAAFVIKPDKVLAMGLSTVKPAMLRHGFQREQILVTGLPKFDVINSLSRVETVARVKPIRIAYFGYSQNQREKDFINQMVELVFDQMRLDAVVEYRPHPFRATMPVAEPELDPRVLIHVHSTEEKTKFGNYPSLDPKGPYYAQILSCDFVISGPTTMGLESLLLGTPTIIDMRLQPDLLSSPMNSLDAYPHIRDFLDTPDLSFFFSSQEGLEMLRSWLERPNSFKKPDLSDLIDTRPFIECLVEQLSRVSDDTKKSR